MGNENMLPKNIRQIGEIQGRQKIYLEDYVMTYIRKMEQKGSEEFLGILLGEHRCTDDAEYVFVRGIMEVPEEPKESDAFRMAEANEKKTLQTGRVNSGTKQDAKEKSVGEKTPEKEKTGLWQAFQKRYGTQEEWVSEDNELGFSEKNMANTIKPEEKVRMKSGQRENDKGDSAISKDRWESLSRKQEAHFPGSQVVGCCVIGTWETGPMEELTQRIPDAKQMVYHLQDQEERLYWLEGERYEGVGGYFVFYEQNQQMQEYLSELFGESSVEKESAPDKAIISFREKVKNKADEKSRSFLKLASSFFVVGALLVGVIAVNRVSDLRQAAIEAGTLTASLEENAMTEDSVSVSANDENDTADLPGTENSATDTAEASDILTGSDAFWADDETFDMTASDAATETDGTDDAEASTSISETDMDTTVTSSSSVTDTDTTSGTGTISDASETSGTGTTSDASETSGTGTASDASEVSATEASVAAASRQVQASYVIRTGDTLAEICAKYYGSLDRLEELCEANGIEDADLIIPGQKIVLP